MNKDNDHEYSVEFSTGAVKDLKAKACKPHLKEIFEEIRVLGTEPLAGDLLEGTRLNFYEKANSRYRSIKKSLK